jgi:hypothetical protein
MFLDPSELGVERCCMSEEYFKRVYRADPANAGKQPESVYLDYALGRRGLAAVTWSGLVAGTLKRLSPDVFGPMSARLWELGNRALGEWAKDNGVRAFDEKPLRSWADKLQKARSQDPGDGSRITLVLDEAAKEIAAFIQMRGLPLI